MAKTTLGSGQFFIGTYGGTGWLAKYTVSHDSDDLIIDLNLDSNDNTVIAANAFRAIYNGTTLSKEITVADGTMQIVFDGLYKRAVNTVTLESAETGVYLGVPNDPWYSGPYPDTTYTITWTMEKNNLPVANFTVPSTAEPGDEITVKWSLSDPDGESVTATSLIRHVKKAGSSSYIDETLISGVVTGNSYTDTFPDDAIAVYYSLYLSDGYGSVTRTSSAISIPNTAPKTPGKPSIPSRIYSGSSITVSWTAAADSENNLSGYVLEVSTNEGSSWSQVYKGSSRSRTYTISEDTESVMFRVKAYDSLGLESAYASSEAVDVIPNTAPTTPGKPVIPPAINGGSTIEITWTASTDAENNLSGYKLERSINGGSSWTQVYQGSANATTDTVPSGTESVMYRVKAYDSCGIESAYAIGSQVIVNNNNAPAAPPSITVPVTVVGGGTVVIRWTAATDPDGDAVTYKLERSVDGGSSWNEIYAGDALFYTDAVSYDWSSVKYRVAAVDDNGGVSGYVTSNERTVITNFAPVLTLNNAPDGMDWGVVSEAPSISFSATDPDGDEVSVEAYVDGVFSCSCGASGVFNFADSSGVSFWNQILNGKHTLAITASDGKESVSQSITFTKKVTECSITLKEPMAVADQIKVCVITVNGYFPADSELTVEVTNNALDSSPVWEGATAQALSGMNHAFANTVQTNGWAFNFRVSAKEGLSGEGGYITSVQGGFQ